MDRSGSLGRLHVCATCSQLYGSVSPGEVGLDPDAGSDFDQRCACGKPEGAGTAPNDKAMWRGMDFNECTTLCYCCRLVPLASGSKYSAWFCQECKRRVQELNQEHGSTVVPIGRHTFLNGVALPVSPDPIEALVDAFFDGFAGMVHRSHRLDLLAKKVGRRNVAFVDPAGGDPSLEHFVTRVQWYAESNVDWSATIKGVPYTKAQAFQRMRRFMLPRPRAAGSLGSTADGTTQPPHV